MNKVVAGIDIGGAKIAIALETLDGTRVGAAHLPTEVEIGAASIVEKILQATAFLPELVSMVALEKVAILPAKFAGESGVCGALALAKQAYLEVNPVYVQ